jgi:hypothetical protein
MGFTVTNGTTAIGTEGYGTAVDPGNTADSDYQAGVGKGNVNADGGNGLVVISCP